MYTDELSKENQEVETEPLTDLELEGDVKGAIEGADSTALSSLHRRQRLIIGDNS